MPFQKGHDVNLGKHWKQSKEASQRLSLLRKGKKKSEETKKRMSISRTGKKRPLSFIKKITELKRGKNCPFWKGGISPINIRIRASAEYRLWREAVFKRDNYTCVWCGTKKSPFNADHIKGFSQFPELRFAIDNGRTLCVPCHYKTDNYGSKANELIKQKYE